MHHGAEKNSVTSWPLTAADILMFPLLPLSALLEVTWGPPIAAFALLNRKSLSLEERMACYYYGRQLSACLQILSGRRRWKKKMSGAMKNLLGQTRRGIKLLSHLFSMEEEGLRELNCALEVLCKDLD